MSIPSSWRNAYRDQLLAAKLLKEEVDTLLKTAEPTWHTACRIKTEDSFYQKIENGRTHDIRNLEDFVGALVVVPLPSDIPKALGFLESFFVTEYRRPPNPDYAFKPAKVFDFNDIRLYGKLRIDESMPPTLISSIVFEIQVRTFFQHAWSSATHDLVYKHASFSWARSRVAAQAKALLEVAEMAIDSIDALESSNVFPSDGNPESELNAFLNVLRAHWNIHDLPADLKRTADTMHSLCTSLSLAPKDLDGLLDRGRSQFRGHPDGWTPYQCVIEYYSRERPDDLTRILKKTKLNGNIKLHITEEILSRLQLRIEECKSAIL